jgi:hypothetical protein
MKKAMIIAVATALLAMSGLAAASVAAGHGFDGIVTTGGSPAGGDGDGSGKSPACAPNNDDQGKVGGDHDWDDNCPTTTTTNTSSTGTTTTCEKGEGNHCGKTPTCAPNNDDQGKVGGDHDWDDNCPTTTTVATTTAAAATTTAGSVTATTTATTESAPPATALGTATPTPAATTTTTSAPATKQPAPVAAPPVRPHHRRKHAVGSVLAKAPSRPSSLAFTP